MSQPAQHRNSSASTHCRFTTSTFLHCSLYCGCTCPTLSFFDFCSPIDINAVPSIIPCVVAIAWLLFFLFFERQFVVNHIRGHALGVERGFDFSSRSWHSCFQRKRSVQLLCSTPLHPVPTLQNFLPSHCGCDHTFSRASCCLCFSSIPANTQTACSHWA